MRKLTAHNGKSKHMGFARIRKKKKILLVRFSQKLALIWRNKFSKFVIKLKLYGFTTFCILVTCKALTKFQHTMKKIAKNKK